MNIDEYVTGERIQMLCDLFIGTERDFKYNPKIFHSTKQKIIINQINQKINNPRIIFLYGHLLQYFLKIINHFENPFILVLHNSDFELNESYLSIIEDPKIIHIFSQNSIIFNKKVTNLPIGIANSMWKHGNLEYLNLIKNEIKNRQKDNFIYLQF